MSSRESLSQKERKTLLIASHYMEYILDIIKRAIKWISLNERNPKSVLYTLDEHVSCWMFWEERGDRTQRVRPLFFFALKKIVFAGSPCWRMFWEERSEISRRASTPFCRPATHRPIWGPTSGAAPAQNIHPNVCPTCLGQSFDTTFHV